MKKKKQRGSLERVTGTIFILVLFVFLLINIIVPDKEKSVQENRMLASAPKWNWGNVISGDYMEKFERYMSDQFVGRDFWRTIKVGVDRLAGVSKEHGVYIGKDGQLLEEIELPNQEYLADNLKSIQNFAETNTDLPVRMMLVPDAAGVLGAKLPAMAEVENQTQLISMVKKELGSSVEWIDAASALNKHRNEKIYYKTDHHWTSLGAFYAFQEAAPSLGIEGDISGKYVSYAVSNDFNGMLASKSGVYLSEKEQVDIYVPSDSDTDVIVDYVDEGKRMTSLFDSSKLDTKDQYDVFLGGDFSVVDIKTVSTESKRLLLIKDSFADCFVQFLTPYYREIVVVDPRYYSGTIEELLSSYRISEVLFLYSGNTFFTDNNISGVLTGE